MSSRPNTIGFWVRVGLREKHEQGKPLGLLPETFVALQVGASAKGSPLYEYRPHPELSALVSTRWARRGGGMVRTFRG
jgi:hypothetical protein